MSISFQYPFLSCHISTWGQRRVEDLYSLSFLSYLLGQESTDQGFPGNPVTGIQRRDIIIIVTLRIIGEMPEDKRKAQASAYQSLLQNGKWCPLEHEILTGSEDEGITGQQGRRKEERQREKAGESPERTITVGPVYCLIECIWRKTFNLGRIPGSAGEK